MQTETIKIPCEYIKRKLTADYLLRVKAETDLNVQDIEVPGYHLRYSTRTNKKCLYLHYVLRADRIRVERNLKLGSYPELSAIDARAEALKCRALVLGGFDPMLERKERVRKAIEEQAKKVPLKVVMEEYLEKHAKPMKKASTYRTECLNARRYIIPIVGVNDAKDTLMRRLHSADCAGCWLPGGARAGMVRTAHERGCPQEVPSGAVCPGMAAAQGRRSDGSARLPRLRLRRASGACPQLSLQPRLYGGADCERRLAVKTEGRSEAGNIGRSKTATARRAARATG